LHYQAAKSSHSRIHASHGIAYDIIDIGFQLQRPSPFRIGFQASHVRRRKLIRATKLGGVFNC
jgi:hypothetical protein